MIRIPVLISELSLLSEPPWRGSAAPANCKARMVHDDVILRGERLRPTAGESEVSGMRSA
jgi:hypothetical protein